MKLNHYQNQPFPFPLHGDDAITFFVLARILNIPCEHIHTDGENVMVCLSKRPYPVWIWCRDEDDADAVATVAECLKTHFPLDEGYRYNLSYGMFERLRRVDPAFAQMKIEVNMLSYRLDELLPISHPCDGHMEAASMADVDRLVPYWQAATYEMEHREFPLDMCKARVEEMIAAGRQFVWVDEDGEIAALTSYRVDGCFGGVGGVYTLPGHRRRGYAMNLVHGVTKRMLERGLVPMLYTDADYAASNACYQKIGYRQVGSLCTAAK